MTILMNFPLISRRLYIALAGSARDFFHEGERRRKASRSIGISSPQKEDSNLQSEEDQMDSAQEKGSAGTSAAPPMGGATSPVL